METLRYVVLVNTLLAIVSVAFYVLLRRETYFGLNRLVLWLGLVAVFVLPLLELPDWRPQPVRTVMQRTARVIVPRVLPNLPGSLADVTITFPNKETYQAFRIPQERPFWSWQTVLVVAYFLGVFVLLVRFGLQLISLKKLISRSIHGAYDGFILVQNKEVTSPFSFFSWVVLNPDQHSPDELEQILRHERVHVRERHSIDMISAEWLCIVFWFNPAAYLFRYLLQQTLEFRADRVVLSEGVDAKTYQYNLLKVSLSAGPSDLTNHFSKSQLKSRIVMLNRQGSSNVIWLKYALFLMALLTVASVCARSKDVKVLNRYVSKPITEPINSVDRTATDLLPIPNNTQTVGSRLERLQIGERLDQESIVQILNPSLGSVNQQNQPGSITEFKKLQSTSHIRILTSARSVHNEVREAITVDDTIISQPLKDQKMENLVLAGIQKYGRLGIGPLRFDKDEVKKQSSPGSYLKVNPDSSLSVDETANFAKVFINNESVAPQAVRKWRINQLYTLAVLYAHDSPDGKQSGTRYILFYFDETR